jgi:hypothetical protein
MSMSWTDRLVIGAIITPLFVIAGVQVLQFLGVDGQQLLHHEHAVVAVAPAEQAVIATPKPVFSPFTAPEATTTDAGKVITRFFCARGMAQVDLAMGKVTTYGGTVVRVTELMSTTTQSVVQNGVQNSVTVIITLGKKTSLPGMIVHTYATLDDSLNAGRMSDQTMLTRLPPGQSGTFVLATDKYVESRFINAISGVTLCLQSP